MHPLYREIPYKPIPYIEIFLYSDRPVIIFPWGKWDTAEVIERGGQDAEDYVRRTYQLIARIQANYYSKKLNESDVGSNNDEVVIIIDYDGFSLRQLQSAKSMVIMINFFARFESCYKKFAYGYILNANSLVHQVIHVGKALMGQFLERIEVYGTNQRKFIPNILKHIPRSQLPEAYGGYKDFQPVQFYG